jgi:hypothetical protein
MRPAHHIITYNTKDSGVIW